MVTGIFYPYTTILRSHNCWILYFVFQLVLSLPFPIPLQMTSDWRRSLGNVRSFVGNSMGGLRGGSNLASWVVAGTLAYFLWVKPSQDLKREQEERAALAAASDPYRYVEKRKPIPDPQETGLIYGNKNRPTKSNE